MSFKVFISHAFTHTALYNSLCNRLDREKPKWFNCSVPRNRRYGFEGDPLPDDAMKTLLARHIEDCEVMLVIAKPVAGIRHWLRWEVEYAKALGKPIIAVWRRQVDLRVSQFVLSNADASVDTWNIRTIVRQIEASARDARGRASSNALPPVQVLDEAVVDVPVKPLTGQAADELAPIDELALEEGEVVHAVDRLPRDVIARSTDAHLAAQKIAIGEIVGADQEQRPSSDAPQAVLQNSMPTGVSAARNSKRWWEVWKRLGPSS